MANSKTTALTELTAIDGSDQLYIVDDPANTPTSKRITRDNLLKDINDLNLAAATQLTLSGGEITATQAAHKLQPESGTTDDLDTINGTSEGDILVLYITDEGTDTITIKHGTGNISCIGGADVELSEGAVIFYSDGTTVYLIGGDGREVLIANRTYYVRTDGDDGNTGLVDSAAGAFLTIQAAVNAVANLDINAKTVTIQVSDGTFSDNVSLKNVVGYSSAGDLVIQGNSVTPTNVVCGTFTADGIASIWQIKNLQTPGITAANGSYLQCSGLDFKAGTYHIYVYGGGKIQCFGNYTISGGGSAHIFNSNGYVECVNRTITLTANVTFSLNFMRSNYLGYTLINGNTYTLGAFAVTGNRYLAGFNSVIQTGGGGANYFPGDAAGSTSTGGQYA